MQVNLEEVGPTFKDFQGFLEKKTQMETWLMGWKMCNISLGKIKLTMQGAYNFIYRKRREAKACMRSFS